MRYVYLLLVLAAATGGLRAAAPASQPSADEIRRLVQQLGHDEFAVREEATRRLQRIGAPALDALKKAVSTDDPELKSRARMLIKRIERHPVPGWDNRFNPDGTLSGRNVHVSIGPDGKTVEVDEGVMHVKIRQDQGGIAVTVTAPEGGQQVTETYTARDPEDLAQQSPEARELFDRWSGGAGPGWMLKNAAGGQMNIQGGEFRAAAVPVLDELAGFRSRLEEQMRKADLPADKRQMLLDHLDKMREAARARNIGINGPDANSTEEFLKLSDELRQKLDDLKLPDPGATLPPGPKSRLGVAIRPANPGGGEVPGMIVMEITADSRGSKVGLKLGDVIQKVNRHDISTVTDLRNAVMAQKPGTLVLEVLREGQSVQLKE